MQAQQDEVLGLLGQRCGQHVEGFERLTAIFQALGQPQRPEGARSRELDALAPVRLGFLAAARLGEELGQGRVQAAVAIEMQGVAAQVKGFGHLAGIGQQLRQRDAHEGAVRPQGDDDAHVRDRPGPFAGSRGRPRRE